MHLDKLTVSQRAAFLHDIGIETKDDSNITTQTAVMAIRQVLHKVALSYMKIALKVINFL
ncbi:hypothetical protein U5B43_08450 [Campylobacter sp. 9BO]|uniref:hypothetical protein n=1 Tax=Campylobacter sp. 9BO TaxID=3424759 RepID=UPI003D332B8D